MKEFEIRPAALFNDFLEVARKDIAVFFSDVDRFVDLGCPAWGSDGSVFSFKKHDMSYRECSDCGSLFMSPRPTQAMIDDYYRRSDSSKFWAERFFPETAEARRELIFKPRAELLKSITERFSVPEPRVFGDIGAGIGLFLDEVKDLGFFEEIVAVEPSSELAKVCREKGYPVVESTLEDAAESDFKVSVASSFEVIEHLFQPVEFLRSAKSILKPGGLFIFTTLTCSGWDIQNLWKESKSVSPPHHINLITTEGLEKIVQHAGLELVELTTPGKLDVDIAVNMLNETPDLELERFATYLLRKRGPECHAAFQKFLQDHRLSSHALVVARVPEAG